MGKYFLVLTAFSLMYVSCADQIVSECENEIQSNLTATFSSIQNEVFTPSCALSGCHVSNSVDPVLSSGVAYNNIVNVMSFNPPFLYVNPTKSDSSYILNKIKGNNIQGERMPINGQPISQLAIDSIAAWIDRGALNN